MKNKEGRRTSWTHGPRWTTHGSSGKHPWWWRSSRRWFLPPAECREEGSWCSRSWKRGGGGTEEISRKRVLSSRVLGRAGYIGEGGQPEVDQGPQAPLWRGLGVAAWATPGSPLAPLWLFPKLLLR